MGMKLENEKDPSRLHNVIMNLHPYYKNSVIISLNIFTPIWNIPFGLDSPRENIVYAMRVPQKVVI